MEIGFDGPVPLCRIVRRLEVCVMVCRVIERSVRRPWASDFSFRARSSVVMCVMLLMIIISVPDEESWLGGGVGVTSLGVSSSSLSRISVGL